MKISGKSFNTLNKEKLRTISVAFMMVELVVSLIIIFLALLINNNVYSFIFIAVGINTFFANVYTYYQFLSQATMKFNGYSIRNTIQAVLTIIFTLLIWILYRFKIILDIEYSNYIILCLVISIIMFTMCIISFHRTTFGNRLSLTYGFKQVIMYCKIGIYLTIAYQVSNLIMIIDNQFVSLFFKPSTYGEYSFSYSMTNTAITLLSAVATVLLPHLKRETYSRMINTYHKIIAVMMLIIYFSLVTYFPLRLIINIFLPEYSQSLSYLKIFLPELGITCSVTMVTFNYYNALGKSKFYFCMSLVILLLSAIIDASMLLFHDPILVAFGSFIAIFIWYMSSEYFLIKWYHVKWRRNFLYMILMINVFFMSCNISNNVIGIITYEVLYITVSFIMFKQIIIKYLKKYLVKI